jgi:hypothetical protein
MAGQASLLVANAPVAGSMGKVAPKGCIAFNNAAFSLFQLYETQEVCQLLISDGCHRKEAIVADVFCYREPRAARCGDLNPEETNINEIATVAALLRKDNSHGFLGFKDFHPRLVSEVFFMSP